MKERAHASAGVMRELEMGMAVKLFVGNLPWSIGDAKLQELFGAHGQVVSAQVVTDRATGRSKGFGFVEMADQAGADAAIAATNGVEMEGRKLTVNVAKPREDRGFGGGGGGGGRRY